MDRRMGREIDLGDGRDGSTRDWIGLVFLLFLDTFIRFSFFTLLVSTFLFDMML